jgi:hypothetical protein
MNPSYDILYQKTVKGLNRDFKVGIVAANNHYGGYGPGTMDIFRENMDMEKLSFDDVNVDKINHLLELESRFNWNGKDKENQISLTDYV